MKSDEVKYQVVLGDSTVIERDLTLVEAERVLLRSIQNEEDAYLEEVENVGFNEEQI